MHRLTPRLGIVALGAVLTASAVLHHGSAPASAAAPDGSAIYSQKCASCHQATGMGLPGAFPPLAKNPYVTGDPTKVIGTLLHGLNGAIKVNGQSYQGAMPAWKGQLSNAEIAAVATYIRSSWGNKASAVTEKQVAAVK